MNAFRIKTIPSNEHLGERFRRARECERETIDRIAKRLSIARTHLAAIEDGAYHKLPGEVYGRHFVRSYARYLGLSEHSCLKEYTRQYRLASSQWKRLPVFQQKKRWTDLSSLFLRMNPFRAAATAFVLLCLLYLSVVVWQTLTPPALIVLEPEDQLMVQTSTIAVRGTTEKDAHLTINGESVLRNDDGSFEELVDLHKGMNTIVIAASKKHSALRMVERRIFLGEEDRKSSVSR